MIELKHLSKTYQSSAGRVEALKDINLTISDGEIFGVIGLSGAGKSTLVRCINLLERPTEGEVWIDGQELTALSRSELLRVRRGIGMIFQDPTAALDPLFTVEQLLLEGLRKYRRMSKKQAREAALESLRMMNLRDPEELMKKKPYELSGGMCQRVMIAIAMSMKPDYLIADEPTTALDVTVQKQILEEIYQLSRKENLGVLFITHDLGVVAEIADDVSIMKDGEIVENGTVEDIFYHPQHSYTKKLLDAVL